jgi:hypothetical protein
MGNNHHKFNEKQLRSFGFEEGVDGIWRKTGSAPPNPPSGGDSKPSKKRPLPRDPQVARPPILRLIAIVTIRTVRPRDYDGLGASTKYYFDALQRIGFIADDSPEHLEIIFDPQKCDHFYEEETKIEIWEIPNQKED